MDNDLDIVLRVRAADDAEAVIVRTLASVQAAAASQGRVVGQKLGKAVVDAYKGSMSGQMEPYNKEQLRLGLIQQRRDYEQHNAKLRELNRISQLQQVRDYSEYNAKAAEAQRQGLIQQRRDIEQFNAQVTEAKRQAQIQQARDIEQYNAKVSEARKRQQIQEQRDYEMWQQRSKEQLATSPQGALSRTGVSSPDAVKRQLEDLRQAKAVWEQAGKGAEGYAGAMAKITSEMNILEAGNARARGSLHKFTAALASATFEITGAVYGLTALASIVGGPALFGASYLKSIEDAQHGIAATLGAMSYAAGGTLKYAETSAIAKEQINGLSDAALKYNISLEDIVKTYQAIIGPGMAAKMTLEEIGRVATIGTVAVKALNLNSQQVVQEVRDLVQGGIQAASSTLATALGLKDADINAAKKSSEGLFVFLEQRLAGYTAAALERQNTLGGAWDLLKIKVQRLFSDEEGFTNFKSILTDISNSIGTIDEKTNKLTFNPELVKVVEDYWKAIKAVSSALGTVVEYTILLAPTILKVAAAFGAFKAASFIVPLLGGIGASAISTASAIGGLATSFGLVPAASLVAGTALSTFSKKAAMMSTASKGGLIGLALFAAYEIADYTGILDSIFSSAEARMTEFQRKAAGLGKISLEAQRDSLEAQIRLARDKEANANPFTAGFATKDRQELERQMKVLEDEMQKRYELQKKSDADMSNLQSAQAKKELNTLTGNLKDKQSALETYNKTVANAEQLYQTATQSTADAKTIAEAKSQRDRIIAEAKRTLNKPDASAMREAKDAYKAEMEQFKQYSEELQQQVLQGEITFIEAYFKKMAKLQTDFPDAAKFGKTAVEKVKTQQATETTNFIKELEKYSKDVETANLQFARSLMLPSEVIESEFSEKFGKISKVVEKGIEEILSVGPATGRQAEILEFLLKLREGIKEAGVAKALSAEAERIKEAFNKIQEAVNIRNAELDLQESQAGGGFFAKQATEAERLALAQDIATAAQERFNKSTEALANITDESSAAYKYQVRVVNEAKAAYIAAQKTQADLANQTDRTFNRGAQQAFESYVENVTNYSKLGSEVWGKAMQTMEDALVSFIKTGKFSFKGFVDYIEELLIKLAAQKFVVSIVGGFGGLLDSVTGGSGSGLGSALGMVSNASTAYGLVGAYGAYTGLTGAGYSGGTAAASSAYGSLTKSGTVGAEGFAAGVTNSGSVADAALAYRQAAQATADATLKSEYLSAARALENGASFGNIPNYFAGSLGSGVSVGVNQGVTYGASSFGTGAGSLGSGLSYNGSTQGLSIAQNQGVLFGTEAGKQFAATASAETAKQVASQSTSLWASAANIAGAGLSAYGVGQMVGQKYGTVSGTAAGTLAGVGTYAVGASVASGAGLAGVTTALASIPVWGWVASAVVALFGAAGGKKMPSMGDAFEGRFAEGNLTGSATSGGYDKSIGAGNILGDMAKAFASTYNGVLAEFGQKAEYDIDLVYRQRRKSGEKSGDLRLNGESIDFGAGREYSLQNMFESIMSTGLTSAFQKSTLPEQIKKLFEGFERFDVSGVTTAIAAVVNMNSFLKSEATNLVEFINDVNLDTYRLEGEKNVDVVSRMLTTILQANEAFEKLNLTIFKLSSDSFESIKALEAAFGGSEGLQTTLTSYYDKFFTAEEKRANLVKDITAQLNAAGATLTESQVGSASIAQWRAAYEEVVRVSGAASPLAVAFLKLHGTIADMAPTAESAATATESFVTAMKKSMSESEALTSSAEKAVTSAKATLQSAYDAEKSRLETLVNTFQSILDSLRAFRNSLLLSNLSTLSPEQKYLEAKRQFEATSSLAKTGDVKAMEALESSSNTFLEASREYYASGEAYAQDFSLVLDALDSTEAIAQREFSNAQQQLSALNQMVSGLLDVKASVLSVEQAIRALMSALSNQQAVAKPEYTQEQYGLGGQWLLDNLGDLETVRKKVLELGLTYAEVLKAAQTVNKELTLEDVTNYLDGTVKYVPPTQGSSSAATTGGTTGSSGTQDYAGVRSWVEGVIASATASGDYYSGVKQIRDASIANGMTSSMLDSIMGWASGSALQAAYNVGLPAFASGGYHSGGIRLVGENGPELEVTGPSRIYSASQTADMLKYGSGIDSQQLAAFNVFSDLMQRLMSKSDAPAQKTENTAPILQAGFNGVIQKLDDVEKRLERIEDDQRKAELDK